MDILSWLLSQFIMWIAPGLLLIFGVAWFMELMEGSGKPNPKEEKRRLKNNRGYRENINKYLNSRYKNPLTVDVPMTMVDQHKEWLCERVKRFEFQFSSFGLEKAKKEEPMFKHLSDYQNICRRIKQPQNKNLASEWKRNG